MFVNIAKYCESIQDVIRSLIETTTKPNQPNPSYHHFTAKYCETIQDVIWSLTEMMTKPTQPLLSLFYCKILRNYSSHMIFDRNDRQIYPTPIIILLQNIANLFKSLFGAVIWSRTDLISKPTQPLIVPLSNLIITLMMYIILSATQSKPHRPGWRGKL